MTGFTIRRPVLLAAMLAVASSAPAQAAADPAVPAAVATAQADANKRALHAYLDAVNRKDEAAVVAAFAPQFTIEDPVGTPVRSGAAAQGVIRQILSGVRYELVSPLRAAGNDVAAVLRVKAGPVAINVIEIFTFDPGHRIAKMRAYWGPGDREPAAASPTDGDIR